MKKMHIVISRDGRTKIAVEGAEGGECLVFSRAFENCLGVVESREFTVDFKREQVSVEDRISENL